MIEIALQNIEKYYGANHVLKGVTFEVNQGERVGLLGKNGTGKTTLFKILAGIENIDKGNKMVRKGAVVGMLDQIPNFPECYTAYDVLYSAFEDIMDVHSQMMELEKLMENQVSDEVLKKYGNLQQIFEAQSGYSVEESINRISIGLKIDNHMAEKKFNLLSGGEKTRVMLGRLMLENPDVLLLDEPTNHLDLSSIEWLEGFLKEYKGTSIIISHDRYFLDKVVDRIVEIVDGKAELYEGNYSYFIKEKEQRYESQLEKYNQQQKKIKQLEEAAKRMHEWAKRADNEAMHKRAFNIEKRIDRMEKTDKPINEKSINTVFLEHGFSSKDIVHANGICKYFDDKKVLDGLDFMVQRNERVALLGDNGSGKSTLIKVITGEVEPDKGIVKIGDSVRYAYLPQIVIFENSKLSILETVIQTLNLQEGPARSLLAKYKFRQEDVHKVVENLSGGEKSRLRLCIMMQNDVNFLLLDEPTNHLDIDSREWLESALQDFTGTLVFVSHDRYFINKFGNRISEISDGKIIDYYGNYEYYKKKKILKQQKKEEPFLEKEKRQREEVGTVDKKIDEAKKMRRELENLINSLEANLTDINCNMENCGEDYEALDSLYKEKVIIEKELEKLYEEWLAISDIKQ